jgi:hypothetical protein
MTTERHYREDTPDLDPRMMRPSTVLQALSPALASGEWLDAKAGDFLLSFEDGSEELRPRIPGVTVQPVAFEQKWMEWPAERGSRSAPIAAHAYSPLDAEWVDIGGRKACIRSSNNNRIEKTVFAHALVDNVRTTFSFRSTSFDVGDRFARDADKARVEIDGEVIRCCGALYRLSSELERNQRGQTWWKPTFERRGVLGQEGGPTLEQVRVARDLRFELKSELERQKAERDALAVVRPTPALSAPGQRSRGSMIVTSGMERQRSSADPRGPAQTADKPTAQPAKSVDPRLDDSLDDLPWQK